MELSKKFSILTPILAALHFSCTEQKSSQLTTLVIGIENEITNFDIRSSHNANVSAVNQFFSQNLLRYNKANELVGDLAETYWWEGGKKIRFKIPRAAQLHNGKQLDCDDILYSFEDAIRENSPFKSSFSVVKTFSCISPFLFQIELKEFSASFLGKIVSRIQIYPRDEADQKQFMLNPVGSGPLRFVERDSRDLIFERFQNYVGPVRCPYDRVILKVLRDPLSRFLALKKGEVDILSGSFPTQMLKLVDSDPDFKIHHQPGSKFQYLALNLKDPLLQKKVFREALSMSIDRRKIIQDKLQGFAKIATSPLAPQNPFFNPQLALPSFSPSKAAEKIKANRALGKVLKISFPASKDYLPTLMLIKNDWEKLGIKVELESHEYASFFSQVKSGDFQIYALHWNGLSEADFLYDVFHSSQLPPQRNRVYFTNSAVDSHLEKSRHEIAPEKRKKWLFEVQKIVLDELPYIPLWYTDEAVATSRRIERIPENHRNTWLNFIESRKIDIDGPTP